MKNEKKMTLSNFEKLTESPEGTLVGGFSASVTSKFTANTKASATNNCNGGNCAAGCGHSTNSN